MTTQALILAAGRGTRLGDENLGRPKCLLDVGGKSILEHQLSALQAVGVRAVVVATGFEPRLVQDAALSIGRSLDLTLTFRHNEHFATTNVLASWRLATTGLHTDYYYLHGDTVVEPAALQLLKDHANSSSLSLLIDRHPCAEEEMKVVLAGSDVVKISKQLDPRTVDGEFSGILHCPASAHSVLEVVAEELLAAEGGRGLFFEACLQAAMDRSLVKAKAVDFTGLRWREIDFPEDLAAARQMFA